MLKAVLTPNEWYQFGRHGVVTITGSDGNRYRIVFTGGVSGNIVQLTPEGSETAWICCHQMRPHRQFMTTWDTFASQVLWIRTNAEEFLEIACSSGVVLPPRRPKEPSKALEPDSSPA